MTNRYTEYYMSQLGGNIPVFRGGMQRGAGLGDVLRGIFRFFKPVALRGATTFATNALSNLQSGMPIMQAAKTAFAPAFAAAKSAAPSMSTVMETLGPHLPFGLGRQQQKQGKVYDLDGDEDSITMDNMVIERRGQKGSGVLFSGEEGIPNNPASVRGYKRSLPTGPKVVKAKRARVSGKPGVVHFNF